MVNVKGTQRRFTLVTQAGTVINWPSAFVLVATAASVCWFGYKGLAIPAGFSGLIGTLIQSVLPAIKETQAPSPAHLPPSA